MRPSRLLPAALLVAAGLTPASAGDLSRPRRAPLDEPKYTTAAPKYCLLAFGPEARTHVWLVHDGGVLHVLDSPDGKAPKRWRQLNGYHNSFALGTVWEDGGQTSYTDLRYNHNARSTRLSVKVGGKLLSAGRDRNGKLELSASADTAPLVHFNGPLTLDLFHEQEPLFSGRTTEISAVVGTPGVGPGTFAHFHCDAYPKGAWPTAVIEFPAKGWARPLAVKVRLADDWGDYCLNPVRVDPAAGSGMARVTLSFAEWKGVRPAVVEIPVNPTPKVVKK